MPSASSVLNSDYAKEDNYTQYAAEQVPEWAVNANDSYEDEFEVHENPANFESYPSNYRQNRGYAYHGEYELSHFQSQRGMYSNGPKQPQEYYGSPMNMMPRASWAPHNFDHWSNRRTPDYYSNYGSRYESSGMPPVELLSIQPQHPRMATPHYSSGPSRQLGHRPSMPNLNSKMYQSRKPVPFYKQAGPVYRDFNMESPSDANLLKIEGIPEHINERVLVDLLEIFGPILSVKMTRIYTGNSDENSVAAEVLFAAKGSALRAMSTLLNQDIFGTGKVLALNLATQLITKDKLELEREVSFKDGIQFSKAFTVLDSGKRMYNFQIAIRSTSKLNFQSVFNKLDRSYYKYTVVNAFASLRLHEGSYFTVIHGSTDGEIWSVFRNNGDHMSGRYMSSEQNNPEFSVNSVPHKPQVFPKIVFEHLHYSLLADNQASRNVVIENVPESAQISDITSVLARYGPLYAIIKLQRKNSVPIVLANYVDTGSAAECVKDMFGRCLWGMKEPLLLKCPKYKSLYIRNISIHVTQSQVESFFGECDTINEVRILRVKEGKDTTICFVDFNSEIGACNAIWKVFLRPKPFSEQRVPLLMEFTQTESLSHAGNDN